MAKDVRLTIQQACEKYEQLTPNIIRTLIDKGTIRAEKVKGVWKLNGHDLKNYRNNKDFSAGTKLSIQDLKARKTEQEVIKLKLQNKETIEKIKNEENTKFMKYLNRVLINFVNWPLDMDLSVEQQKLWNDKLDQVADMFEMLEEEDKEAEDVVTVS